eukprot:TRINITY_DN8162_c0_g1_i1.p2 TRINITY_DN8162_c0_g1~~TRINITY_DN8162_c0_g1_i1.p2  ORF type:complete len:131 (+),score=22.08 TRINITY_DN8162_c0_g1_i1:205-597(+)
MRRRGRCRRRWYTFDTYALCSRRRPARNSSARTPTTLAFAAAALQCRWRRCSFVCRSLRAASRAPRSPCARCEIVVVGVLAGAPASERGRCGDATSALSAAAADCGARAAANVARKRRAIVAVGTAAAAA